MLESYKNKKRVMYKSYKLTPGDYVAYVKIDFNPKYEEDFEVNLAVYSDFTCGITIATRDSAFKFTGNKNVDWDGVKKKKPVPVKTVTEVHSTTFIEIKETKHDEKLQVIVEGE